MNAPRAPIKPARIRARPKNDPVPGKENELSGQISGCKNHTNFFCGSGSIRRATVYPPSAMKPLGPRENCPVIPLIRLYDTAATM